MKKKILIIDDQTGTRRLLSRFLSRYFETEEMESVVAAVEWFRGGGLPDAVLCDVLLPEQTGIDFLRLMASGGVPALPVLMLSGVENTTEKIRCLELGARDYLQKPFNPEELLLRLKNILATSTASLPVL